MRQAVQFPIVAGSLRGRGQPVSAFLIFGNFLNEIGFHNLTKHHSVEFNDIRCIGIAFRESLFNSCNIIRIARIVHWSQDKIDSRIGLFEFFLDSFLHAFELVISSIGQVRKEADAQLR